MAAEASVPESSEQAVSSSEREAAAATETRTLGRIPDLDIGPPRKEWDGACTWGNGAVRATRGERNGYCAARQ
ncbi:hypothetical protein GCM10009540_12730 [Streptomyces turgidiscabies]